MKHPSTNAIIGANLDTIQELRDRIVELEAALKKIDRATTEWDANKLGGVHIQRKRWQRCGEIAREALVTSVTCGAPPDAPPASRHTKYESTVPKAISPRSARARSPPTFSSSQ